MTWQIQITGTLDLHVDAQLFVVDLFDAPDAPLRSLRASGRYVVCQFSAGTRESWRPDVGTLPGEVIGKASRGAPGETWLDIRAPSVRAVMAARLERALVRGCHGVVPDAIDGYASDTGFSLVASDAQDYLAFLASEGHTRGLAVGLANGAELVASTAAHLDFVLEDRCLEFDECRLYRPFLSAGRPVFHVELAHDAADGDARLAGICGDPRRAGFSTLLKLATLDAWRLACE